MLTIRRPQSLFGVIAAGILLFASLIILGQAPSAPAAPHVDPSASCSSVPPGHLEAVIVNGEVVNYHVVCPGGDPGGGGPSGGGPSGGHHQSCEFVGEFNDFCEGQAACLVAPSSVYNGGVTPPGIALLGPPPSPDAIVMFKFCRNPDGSTYNQYYWSRPGAALGPPPLRVLAQRAYDKLVQPSFHVDFSAQDADADTITYVGTQTFFWVSFDNPGDGGVIKGGPVFGVTAVGEPDHLEIDPGDGSGTFTCPWATAKTDECMKEYLETSADSSVVDSHGVASFRATVTLIYKVHFENAAGNTLSIPALAAQFLTFPSDPEAVPIPVGEIQAIING